MKQSRERVVAVYLVETPYSLEHTAGILAGEQSTGTFTAVPGETDDLKREFGAVVEGIRPLEIVDVPSLPGASVPAGHSGGYRRGEVRISFPLHNFGPSIPNLMTAVAGNLYELQELSGLRLLDLELPEAFVRAYRGPRFGIEGTRELCGVSGRPIIGTIVKPSVGLPMEALGRLITELALSGLDFIKDDELNADPPYAPFALKVETVMDAVRRAADRTGKQVMYAFNITGDMDQMRRNHDQVVQSGGSCVMASINSIGFTALTELSRYSEVPIHGHRNQWGMLTRCPQLGMDFRVYQKLARLAGADHIHVNGLRSKFYESDQSVIHSIRSCLTPLGDSRLPMPVISSGQWAGTAVDTYAATGTVDVMHLAGGGILAHPDGPTAGVKSMKLGWEAAVKGESLAEYAARHPVLQRAVDKFGAKS
ncbi:ribulose-bisphosphate carboxylase large subunit family protein [Paenibacillus sepulcri]